MSRRPNDRMRALLAEAGWTGDELARAVNRLGDEAGLKLRYDRTAVSHWLTGIRPRSPVADLVAEAFSRKLSRRVTTADVGLSRYLYAPYPAEERRSITEELAVLSRAQDSSGSQRHPANIYHLHALAVPAWVHELALWPIGPRVEVPALDVDDVDTAEAMAPVFATCDAAFGGGSTRRALGGYLSRDLALRLTERGRPAIQRRLFRIGAQLACLCGFMCFDDELNGLAQRYYLTALQLAAYAGDQATYAVTLREMSAQALWLGHTRHAVQNAEAAAATAKATGRERWAFLYGHLAVAHAAERDRINATSALAAAEDHLNQADSTLVVGAYNTASLAYQQGAVRNLLGDCEGAAAALAVSVRYRPASQRRARAITLANLAELQLRQGKLGPAVSTWRDFLDDFRYLASARADTALKAMRALLRPYARQPSVQSLLVSAIDVPRIVPGTHG